MIRKRRKTDNTEEEDRRRTMEERLRVTKSEEGRNGEEKAPASSNVKDNAHERLSNTDT